MISPLSFPFQSEGYGFNSRQVLRNVSEPLKLGTHAQFIIITHHLQATTFTSIFYISSTFVVFFLSQTQGERDELYNKFVKAIHEVQQKSNFKNLLLEKKLSALADTLEKKVRSAFVC